MSARKPGGDAAARDDGVIRLEGDLVFGTVPKLWHAQRDLFEQDDAVTVDLGAVGRVDSSALALLLGWIRLARQAGKTLAFTHVPEPLLAIARVSGIDDLLRDPTG